MTAQPPPVVSLRYKFPAQSRFSPARGPKNAPLQILELLNPRHPDSRTIQQIRTSVWSRFPGMVRWTVRFNPQIGKDRGYLQSLALLTAHRRERFWSYLPKLLQATKSPTFKELCQLAQEQGLNPQEFEVGLQFPPYKVLIDRDLRWSQQFGYQGQPRLFLNGIPLEPPYTSKRIHQALQRERQRIQSLLRRGTTLPKLYKKLTMQGKAPPKLPQFPAPIQSRMYRALPLQVLEGTPVRGPGDAAVTIVEFSDFTCVPCRRLYFHIHTLQKAFPTQIRFLFKYYPIGLHRESYRASELAAAAQSRGKFWPLYQVLFQEQDQLLQGNLLQLAQKAGLDRKWVAGELDRHSYRRRTVINRIHALRLGMRAVPILYINGYRIKGVPSLETLRQIIQEELWKAGEPNQTYP